MKYILIANNTKIDLTKIQLEYDDLVILFGRQCPLASNKIRDHKNKILFLRNREHNKKKDINTNHQHTLITNHQLYKKIIIYPKNNIQMLINSIDDFDHDKIINIYDKINILTEYKNFPSNYVPTTGFIAYLYVKYYLNKDNSKIVLFGFDGIDLWYKHSGYYEGSFYKQEILNNKQIIFDIGYK